MRWLAVATFPQLSVAVHVRVMTLLQLEPGLLSVCCKTTVTAPPQLSEAVTSAGGGTVPPHSRFRSPGTPLIAGGMVSLKLMRWLAVATLPQLSVAVQVRVITLLQLEPGLLSVCWNTGVMAPPQLSVGVTAAGGGTLVRHCIVSSAGTPFSRSEERRV